MKFKICYLQIVILFFFSCLTGNVVISEGKGYSSEAELKLHKPEFWLSKLDNPDKIILTETQIKSLNTRVYKKKYLVNPLVDKKVYQKASTIKAYFDNDLRWIKSFKKYDINNNPVDGTHFSKRMKSLMDYDNITDSINRRYALVTSPAYIRVFPTDNMVLKKTNDKPFDILQISFLDTNEPVSYFHTSRDGQWAFVVSAYRYGWIKLKNIAWTYQKKKLYEFLKPKQFVMALAWEVPVYLSDDLDDSFTVIHMGTRLPLFKADDDYYIVKVPVANEKGELMYRLGYIRKDDSIITDYLPCTPRNIAQQAFRMLHQPYSWGGLGFGTDCSSFIRRIFLTTGLCLPRSSLNQIKHLKNVRYSRSRYSWKRKIYLLNKLKPFESILYYHGPSHVMLYLGRHNDQHYVIHNKWSYRKPVNDDSEEEIFLKKVLVTDLRLGEKSSDGSLLERISRISVLK